MTVRRSSTTHMPHAVSRRVGPVALGYHPAAVPLLLLLGPIVGGVPDVHAVVGREPGIGHTLGRLPRGRGTAVMVWGNALPKPYYGRVSPSTRTMVGARSSTPLRHHGGTIVLVLVRVFRWYHATIAQVRDVRVGKVGTHNRQ